MACDQAESAERGNKGALPDLRSDLLRDVRVRQSRLFVQRRRCVRRSCLAISLIAATLAAAGQAAPITYSFTSKPIGAGQVGVPEGTVVSGQFSFDPLTPRSTSPFVGPSDYETGSIAVRFNDIGISRDGCLLGIFNNPDNDLFSLRCAPAQLTGATAFDTSVAIDLSTSDSSLFGEKLPIALPALSVFDRSARISAVAIDQNFNFLFRFNVDLATLTPVGAAPVPEPGPLALIALGIFGISASRRAGRSRN
jgi:hypothetical protein